MTESRDHAVVVGGGIAGLLAAGVLTDHFSRVTIVERDRLPSGARGHRPGLAHGRHLHVLWGYGLDLMEGLLPGLEERLRAAGAPDVRMPADLLWLTAAGWRRRFEVTRLLTPSRGLLDHTVRAQLADRVQVLPGHEVTGLIPAARPGAGGARVAGVEMRERGTSIAAPQPLDADFVVDASGRGSRTPEWLARLGYPFPHVSIVDPLLGYASREYAIPDGFDPGWKALYLQAAPPGTRRTGGLFPQEGGRWIVSLSGAGRDYGPTGEQEFLDFARGLRSPVLYEAIKKAEPLTPIAAYRRTANDRRHFDRLPAWPEGFVALGDTVSAFNPIYSHGMTVAAIQAGALRGLLGEQEPGRLGRRFQRLAARAGAGAWRIATGEDLRYHESEGVPVPLGTKISNRYADRVVAAANVDQEVCGGLLDVVSLAARPASLARPAMVSRVLTTRERQPQDPGDLLPKPRLSVTGA